MEEFRFIWKYVRDLLAHTEDTWRRLRNPDLPAAQPEYMLRTYYWPMMGVCSIFIFLLHGNGIMIDSPLAYGAPFSLELGMKGAVSFILGYTAGPTLAILLIRELFCRLTQTPLNKDRLELLVYYSMSFLMLCDLFCSLLPSLTFLSLISLYVLYIVWLGTTELMDITDRLQRFFLVVACVAIYFSADIIQRILHLIAS